MSGPSPLASRPTDAPPPRVRGVSKNTPEARRKILQSATATFGAQGFARARTEEIAEIAGYGQATVFFHFKTKAGLLEACLEDSLQKARASLVPAEASSTLDLVQRLDRVFDDAPTAAFLGRMLSEFGESLTIRPIYAAFHHQVRLQLAEALSRDTGVTAEAAYGSAALILSAMVGIHAEQRLEVEHISREAFSDMLLRVTRLVLADLSRQTP